MKIETAISPVKERGILFSSEMVRAILDGRKTQTRRIIKYDFIDDRCGYLTPMKWKKKKRGSSCADEVIVSCPYGGPGDILYVREAFCMAMRIPNGKPDKNLGYEYPIFRADKKESRDLEFNFIKWKPGIHLPKKYSRIKLEITAVRAERLQEIRSIEAMNEGIPGPERLSDFDSSKFYSDIRDAKDQFRALWEKIHGPLSWKENPLVWVITFKRIY